MFFRESPPKTVCGVAFAVVGADEPDAATVMLYAESVLEPEDIEVVELTEGTVLLSCDAVTFRSVMCGGELRGK